MVLYQNCIFTILLVHLSCIEEGGQGQVAADGSAAQQHVLMDLQPPLHTTEHLYKPLNSTLPHSTARHWTALRSLHCSTYWWICCSSCGLHCSCTSAVHLRCTIPGAQSHWGGAVTAPSYELPTMKMHRISRQTDLQEEKTRRACSAHCSYWEKSTNCSALTAYISHL